MKNFFIKNKTVQVILLCLAIVVTASLIANLAKAKYVDPQIEAAKDALIQQQIKADNQGCYDAYIKASERLLKDLYCQSDKSKCSFLTEVTPAQ